MNPHQTGHDAMQPGARDSGLSGARRTCDDLISPTIHDPSSVMRWIDVPIRHTFRCFPFFSYLTPAGSHPSMWAREHAGLGQPPACPARARERASKQLVPPRPTSCARRRRALACAPDSYALTAVVHRASRGRRPLRPPPPWPPLLYLFCLGFPWPSTKLC